MIEIGSEYAWEGPMGASQRPPWEGHGECAYFQTGRQALSRIEERLIDRGVKRLVMAPPFCESMVSPFRFLELEYVKALTVSCIGKLGCGTAIFFQPLYGALPRPSIVEALRSARTQGVQVVADFTHAPFTWNHELADFSVASLRKMFPLADGAVLLGAGCGEAPIPPEHPVELKLSAMRQKLRYLRSKGTTKIYLQTFREGENALTSNFEARPISTTSWEWLRSADYELLQSTRRRNAVHLASLLSDLGVAVLNFPGPDTLPSHLVVRHEDRDSLRAFLIRQAVYCPIHWLPPTGWRGSWPNDVLSFPVDHRYGAQDMEHVNDIVRRYLEERCKRVQR